MTPLAPGATIGVLGGGQLGRMLALAAARLGYDAAVFCPDPDAPAARVAAWSTTDPYDDLDAVRAFAERCDVVTYEFENVPLAAARAASEAAPVRPGTASLEHAQDRFVEKTFARDCGADTVAFQTVESAADIAAAVAEIGGPVIVKTRRLGYDGKGQARAAAPGDAEAAWDTIGRAPAIAEAVCPFVREVSAIVARGVDRTVAFPITENTHAGGVLRESRAPARVNAEVAARAGALAAAIADRLDHIGVLAVEFFVTEDDALVFNELAPRVHNSGHWTQDFAWCDQFEQHVRAIAGLALGDPGLIAPCRMDNLIGPEGLAAGRDAAMNDGEARVHLYAKRAAREGRKVGHINRPDPSQTLTND